MTKGLKQQIGSYIRRHGTVAAYAVMGVSVGVILMSYLMPMLYDRTTFEQTIGDPEATSASAYTLAESEPMRLRIPKLNIDAPFTVPLGLDENREVEIPKGYEEVGWYKHGPTPGELGPSVILGHVDSFEGPAIFYPLGQLEPGDLVEVLREDGTVATFTVTGLERYDQKEFPTQKVYGNIDHAGIRLVTCTGTFDRGVQRYTHNLVVYGTLLEPEDIDPITTEDAIEE